MLPDIRHPEVIRTDADTPAAKSAMSARFPVRREVKYVSIGKAMTVTSCDLFLEPMDLYHTFIRYSINDA
jgi:hypothetical protein